jgi:hypothetical protein
MLDASGSRQDFERAGQMPQVVERLLTAQQFARDYRFQGKPKTGIAIC